MYKMNEKNRCLLLLQVIKDNIAKGNKPIYNPFCMFGLTKKERFSIFFRYFNKSFNSKYKIKYISCEKINENDILNGEKKLVIIENIDYLENDENMQRDIYYALINDFLKDRTQFILCSDKYVENLNLEEKLKNILKSGLCIKL